MRWGEDSPQLRKARGAFFTPALLCDYVVNWAIRRVDDQVLEPSCGDAEFLVAATERLGVTPRGEATPSENSRRLP